MYTLFSRAGPFEWVNPVARATIRRDRIFEDGYAQLNNLGIYYFSFY